MFNFIRIKSKQITVIPVKTFYNIESDNIDNNIKEELRLREFIRRLYDILSLDSGIIDLTNLVFFELDGVQYVGYNVDYDVKINCKSRIPGTILTDRKITNFSQLNKLIYIHTFLNREAYMRKISSNFNGIKFTGAHALVKNNFRKNSSVFRYYNTMYTEEMLQLPNALYLVGMCSKESRIFRENISHELINIIGLDSVREKVDSFGCFNKISNPILEL